MENNTLETVDYKQLASQTVYNTYINCYLRETTSWVKYFRKPKHDQALAAYMEDRGFDRWIRIDLRQLKKEIFCPLAYYSFTGRHQFHFPIAQRELDSNNLTDLSLEEFARLTSQNYLLENKNTYTAGLDIMLERLKDSIENTANFIRHRHSVTADIDTIFVATSNFIETEQSLLLGHAMHPVAKSRIGFSKTEMLEYSPETRGHFQLHYFLVQPELIWEKNTGTCISDRLKDQLLQDSSTDISIKDRILELNDWKILPCHPWQAKYMLEQPVTKELIKNNLLISLGECGSKFTATSSVRTVYNDDCDFMLKFSLNVRITNSERINLPKELVRGYEFCELMNTEFGKSLNAEYPNFYPVTDPGFIAVRYKGEVINGFSTSVRSNPFSALKDKNISLLAAWCQDPILPSQKNRIVKTIDKISETENRRPEEVSLDWFSRYLQISLVPLVKMYNSHGLFLEAHGQNCLLELDEKGYPSRFYFRDNQGYFFRKGTEGFIRQFVPNAGKESLFIANISFLNPKFTYYFVINNIITVINTIGRGGLATEEALLELMHDTLIDLQAEDTTGWVSYMLKSRDLEVKANLLTRLNDYDELIRPLETHAVYVDYPNPLLVKHFSTALLEPETLNTVFSKERNGLTFTLRPFNLEKDLELVHEWFHREHTIPFWAMNLPLKELEAFYINLEASDYSHAFIGELNGEPLFTTEYYWAMRDLVGKYYQSEPDDYGMHICIAPAEREKRHSLAVIRTILDYLFAQPQVGRCIGESHRDNKAALGLFKKVGYELQRVIDLPNKPANLTFLSRQSYINKLLGETIQHADSNLIPSF